MALGGSAIVYDLSRLFSRFDKKKSKNMAIKVRLFNTKPTNTINY